MAKHPVDDFDDNLPSLRADDRDEVFFDPEPEPAEPRRGRARREPEAVYSRSTPVVKVKAPGSGALWALVVALVIALGGLGWWSVQQISLMEQQLVATQESFAKVSEEAAGRLRDISGKVAAGETSATTDVETLKVQVKQLQGTLDDQNRAAQGFAGQQGDLGKRIEQLAAQQAANEQAIKAMAGDLATLKAAQAGQGATDAQLKSLAADVATLKKQPDPNGRIERLEQELIVLKSEQDNRAAQTANAGPSNQEFDAFRGQSTRNFNTLQSQIQNLQQQIDARR
ncbi:ATPase [Pseudomonas typographi]|uniref:ATPase n=1 Tax=Pseudomonas typographi TaxID=2715964 RepID=A0ABR7YWB2_9PSED|nr:ATPase [Pseudomonas typographi]MBD1552517.1 ATPase [Pseudomonas typographi]MBD1585607.1 ATPase [Pseudomonas typographi]MBD1597480.1 ATPase [Pseudomonas typographi]